MSTLESIKNNLSIARNLLVEGRDRYLGVTRVALSIEQIYRKQRHRAKFVSVPDAQALLIAAHEESAQKIVDLCKENGAIWVKFGQFLSCRPDVLPMEYVMALQALQNSAIPAPFEAIHPMIVTAWGDKWDERFKAFDIKPSAAASVAQVHRAVLRDGRQVAVKFQLPDVRELFEQDSLVFRSVAAIVSPLIREFDIRQMTDQLIKLTLEELDFRREAANLRKFTERTHMPGIRIPQLVDDLCTEKILVTDWIEGTPMSRYLEQHPDRAAAVLTRLLHSYIQQVTQFGVYHADPHPGNFIVSDSGEIAILDYGAIAYLSKEETQSYGALLLGLMGMPGAPLGELFRRAGFVCENQQVLEEISYHFIGDNRREKSVSDRLNDILERLRTNRVTIPDSFIAMARVIISVGGLMKRYDVGFEWSPVMAAG
jgi:ubiquinone biosynthesis protein